MMTLDEVREYVATLPNTSTGYRRDNEAWMVEGSAFAWTRPFSKADIKRFKPADPPSGVILAITTTDLDDKEAILAEGTKGFFTIEHFNNYPAYLVQLDVAHKRKVKAALLDGWLAKAPEELAKSYLAKRR